MGYLTHNNIEFFATEIVPLSISWISSDDGSQVIVPKGTKIPCRTPFSIVLYGGCTSTKIIFCEGDSKLGIYNNKLTELIVDGFQIKDANIINGEIIITIQNEIIINYFCSHKNGKVIIEPKKYIKDLQFIENKLISDKQNNELIDLNEEKVLFYQLKQKLETEYKSFKHLIINNEEKNKIEKLINEKIDISNVEGLNKFLINQNLNINLSNIIDNYIDCLDIMKRYIYY